MRTALIRSMTLGLFFGLAAAAPRAQADINEIDQFRNDAYTQTGDGNSLTFNGTFIGFRLNSDTPNEYDTVQVSYPGSGSPITLNVDPIVQSLYSNGSNFLPDRAALQTAFPFGTYTFSATNGFGTDTASYDYTSNAYPLSVPYLTGTDYSNLQGLNAGTSFTFHFSNFTPDPAVSTDNAFQFFTIFDAATGAVVYSFDFLTPAITSVFLPANTLMAGHDYAYELDFSDRLNPQVAGSPAAGTLGFDIRSAGLFTTAAVPEPSTLLLTAIGTCLLGCGRLRRRRS